MLRRFPPEALEEAVRTLEEEGFVEVTGDSPDRLRVRLTRHHRVFVPRTPRPEDPGSPPERVEAPIVLPPLPFADSDVILEALRMAVEEASRFARGEVYLGPFMKRRMNAAFPDLANEDRKEIVDHLRDLGCVTLERRQGERMEYTVLLVDRNHPAVRQVWRAMERNEPPRATSPRSPETFIPRAAE